MEKCRVLMKIAQGEKTSSYMVEQVEKGEKKYFKLNVPNMTEGNEIELLEGTEIDLKELKDVKLEDLNPAWIERYKKWERKRKRLLAHLAAYKRDVLKIEASGFWRGNEYAHILPEGMKDKNLIDAGFLGQLQERVASLSLQLHPAFGHLNSSQAMCLNFMVPLLERGALLDCIKEACPGSVRGGRLVEQAFEKVVDEAERTQFDFYCTTDAGETLSFEFKYSEPDFSFMEDDERHREKFEETYKGKLEELGIGIDKETFAEDYQLWRNILYAGTHQHTVFFALPKFREDLKKVVDDAKGKCPEEIQQRIHCIFIDDLVEELLRSVDSALKGHYAEFKEKYLPERL